MNGLVVQYARILPFRRQLPCILQHYGRLLSIDYYMAVADQVPVGLLSYEIIKLNNFRRQLWKNGNT